MIDYQEFLKNKIALSVKSGFDIDKAEINPMLKPHQKDIVQWSLAGGCRAIFAAFGLGKSFMQLEILRIIGKHEGGKQLIIAPLGVRQEFKIDAEKLGIEIKFIRRTEEHLQALAFTSQTMNQCATVSLISTNSTPFL